MDANIKIDEHMENGLTMQEISRRFKQYRIACSLTQADLAEKSMVSLSTIKRFENGGDIGFSKLILLLKALGLTDNLNIMIPDQTSRPSYYLEKEPPRQRVRKKAQKNTNWK